MLCPRMSWSWIVAACLIYLLIVLLLMIKIIGSGMSCMDPELVVLVVLVKGVFWIGWQEIGQASNALFGGCFCLSI